MAVEITDANFEEIVLKSDKPVLVDFWAEWCGPCKQIGPILEEISNEMSNEIVIAKLNISEIKLQGLKELRNTSYSTSGELTRALINHGIFSNAQALKAIEYAELKSILVSPTQLNRIDRSLFTPNQMKTLIEIKGQSFNHKWKFNDALMESSEEWHIQGGLKNKLSDRHTLQKLSYLHRHFFK